MLAAVCNCVLRVVYK